MQWRAGQGMNKDCGQILSLTSFYGLAREDHDAGRGINVGGHWQDKIFWQQNFHMSWRKIESHMENNWYYCISDTRDELPIPLRWNVCPSFSNGVIDRDLHQSFFDILTEENEALAFLMGKINWVVFAVLFNLIKSIMS